MTSISVRPRVISVVGVQLSNLGFGEAGFASLLLADVPDTRFGIAVNVGQNRLVQVFVLRLAVFVLVEEFPILF